MIHRLKALAPIALASVSLLALPAAYAEDVKLPPTMVVTAYDTGTAGFNIAVGVGKMMKDKYGTDVRVLPAGNDVARLAPLRAKRAAMSAMGSGTYFAQEGVFEFGTKEWGPQALQLVLSVVDCNAGSLGGFVFRGESAGDDLSFHFAESVRISDCLRVGDFDLCGAPEDSVMVWMHLRDGHSPRHGSANGPMADVPAFYEAFGVKPGQKLYRATPRGGAASRISIRVRSPMARRSAPAR